MDMVDELHSLKKLMIDINSVRDRKINHFKIVPFMIISIILNRSFRNIFLYRITNDAYYRKQRVRFRIFYFIKLLFSSIEISYLARIGPGLIIPHPQCIVIGDGCILGDNVGISQGVTIGATGDKEKNGKKYPIIGNNVWIGAGAKVIGPVIIGENSIVGANAVVLSDIDANSIAVGVPAVIVRRGARS